ADAGPLRRDADRVPPARESLVLQLHPGGGVVGTVRPAAHLAVDAGSLEPPGQWLRQKEVIEPQTGVALPTLAHVVPEGEDLHFWVLLAEGVNPTLVEEPLIGRARFWLQERVAVIGAGLVDVERRRYHVVVAREDHRQAGAEELGRVRLERRHPPELVVEL